MDFVEQAKEYRTAVEEAIQQLFQPNSLVDGSQIPAELADVMRYALLTGGKRLRPVLCLAACQTVSGEFQNAIPAALAMEVLHTYTLVHDDLPCMDNDLLRRGQPTVHAKFGEAQAVLAGDALQALAFRLLLKSPVSAETLKELLDVFSKAAGPAGVIGGQWIDVTAKPPHDEKRVQYVHEHKTADLIRCAVELGAIVGQASKKDREDLRLYGLSLGMAFQIIDDILDADDPSKANEMSILQCMSLKEARNVVRDYTAVAVEIIQPFQSVWGRGYKTLKEERRQGGRLLAKLAEDQANRKI